MYQWLSNVIKTEYQFVKSLKKSDTSQVLVYKNKNSDKKVVVRYICDGIDIYETLLTVKSRHLPQIYEVARGENNAIVLEEYIEGMTVGDVLEGGTYNEKGVSKICKQVCDGLTILHTKGIIHRDIKPENIMMTKEGGIKLIDFNASKQYKEEAEKDTKILGTTGFAAPEQYGISQSDARTDIYAMGVLINVMLTGEHPSKKMCTGRMKKIVTKAVSMNPDDRYQSSEELREVL